MENPLNKINWKMLKHQKEALLNIDDKNSAIQGIVNLLDSIQDYAVDVLGKPEDEVFNLREDEPEYSEHEKLQKVAFKSQIIGNFLDHCGLTLCEAGENGFYPQHNIEKNLANYFEIDLNKIEREKRAMIDKMRELN